MRCRRMRFTVRRMMIAVAVTAVLLGIAAKVERRAARFRRLSFLQSVEANRWDRLLADPAMKNSAASAILEKVHWHDDMAARYARAARFPWLPIDDRPPAPHTPELDNSTALEPNRF
jgi:hypothetical protein